MYYETEKNDKLIYASGLTNGYAWDTAIIFIQTYSTDEKASTYASQNKSTSFANTGINNDKYCNIWDMSGNVNEWTTESSTEFRDSYFYPCVRRGGHYNTGNGGATSSRRGEGTKLSLSDHGFRPLLYVK